MSACPAKEGVWFYESVSPIYVRIEEVDYKPGSGDYEDAEEDNEDVAGRYFHIVYTAAAGTDFCNGGGYFPSLEEAVREAEKAFKDIKWK
jgi:hypothetical protein